MKERSFYLFNQNIQEYYALRKQNPIIQAIWYDGSSDLIKDLDNLFNIKLLIIEEKIYDSVQKVLNLKNINNVQIIKSRTEQQGTKKKICVFPSNDTHVHSFKNLIKKDNKLEVYISKQKKENAESALTELGIPFKKFQPRTNFIKSFSGFVCGNDWGWVEKLYIKMFQNFSIPTFCLQESVIDFGESSNRMQYCDFPVIQGINTLKYFRRNIFFLTGNPRYEDLTIKKPPQKLLVTINSNFTYNIYTEIQKSWIETIVNICKSMDLDYLILQHPRDKGDLSKYNHIRTNAKIVHSFLEKSSLIISRFSSVIHECLAMGKPVIYYNPHSENMYYDFEPDQKHFYMVSNASELQNAFSSIIDVIIPSNNYDFYKNYIRRHIGTHDGKAQERVLNVIDNFSIVENNSRNIQRNIDFYKLLVKFNKIKLSTYFR